MDNSDNSLKYVDILKKTVQDATIDQPSLQAIKLYPVCDALMKNTTTQIGLVLSGGSQLKTGWAFFC